MSLRFYTDTHIAKQIAIQLRNRGVDVIRCEEVGRAKASDTEHLEYAAQENRALVSIDEDFPKLHGRWLAAGKAHAGIFKISKDLQGESGIGKIVTELFEYFQLVDSGAASLTDDIENMIIYIR